MRQQFVKRPFVKKFLNKRFLSKRFLMHGLLTPLWAEVMASKPAPGIVWAAMGMGVGIWVYFALSHAPSSLFCWSLAGAGALVSMGQMVCLFTRRLECAHERVSRVRVFFLAGIGGFFACLFRTSDLQTPCLATPVVGQSLRGEVESLSPTPQPGRFRLTLKNVSFMASGRTLSHRHHRTFTQIPQPLPRKVVLRLSTPFPEKDFSWGVGDQITVIASLFPVATAPSPFGCCPRREAFFRGIGAQGIALNFPRSLPIHTSLPSSFASPPKPLECILKMITTMRQRLTTKILRDFDPPLGSIGAALITGDAGALSLKVRQTFAHSGLAHVLAISGLHLSIVAGFCFIIFHRGLALCQTLALGYPLHKLAAVFTLLAAFFYVLLSGTGLPAQRAWVMTSVYMLGILMDRRTLSLRTLALGAICVLAATPEVLLSASFQLSFAAVTGLVCASTWAQNSALMHSLSGRVDAKRPLLTLVRRWGFYLATSMASSLIASCATAPFIMVFFHQANILGLVSNLVAIPLLTFCVMPLAVCYSVATGIGCEGLIIPLFRPALAALLALGEGVSRWPGAVIAVPLGTPWGLGAFVMGGMWVCLWESRVRWLGVISMILGAGGLLTPHVPDFWIDNRAKVFAYPDSQTGVLWVSSLRRSRFLSKFWAAEAGASQVRQLPHAHDSQVWPPSFLKNLSPDDGPASDSLNAHTLDQGKGAAVWLKGGKIHKILFLKPPTSKRPWD